MRKRSLDGLRAAVALTLALGGLILFTGCPSMPSSLQAPTSVVLPQRSIDDLKQEIRGNSAVFRTLRAECRVTLRTPLMAGQAGLEMSGPLVLEKSEGSRFARVHVKLGGPGKLYAELISDGERYSVNMPIFQDMSYGCGSDDALRPAEGRVHFMPADLAAALDPALLFVDRSLVLRAYPRSWDLEVGSIREPAIAPPVWEIACIGAASGVRPSVWVDGSILLNRNTEQIDRVDRFRRDGTLVARIWYLGWTVARDTEGRAARVPRDFILWYPPPLEGTTLHVTLSNVKINEPPPEGAFQVE